MSDSKFDSIRKFFDATVVYERRGLDAIDAAEAAYKHLGESQAEQVRIIKGAIEVNQQLRARIAELERITLFVREVAAANARIAEATKVEGEPND